MRRRKLKRKFRLLFKLILFIIIGFLLYSFIKAFKSKNYILSIDYDNNLIVKLIEEDNLYCTLSNDTPNIDSDNWVKSYNNQCVLNYNNEKNVFIKNNNRIVYSTINDLYYEIKDDNELYLASNDKYYAFKYLIGNNSKLNIKIDDPNIIEFKEGYIIPKKEGETKISINYNNKNKEFNIITSSLITKRPTNSFDFNKDNLKCEKYSEEENDLIDKILEYKVNKVGYKTRAGVVEAARFLTLDFPYRINYFYENGRLGTNKVDGEGRYYHKGLYLDESRYEDISGSTTLNNIGTWGCSIYSVPIKDYDNNGLDCSGFVSWALLNGGFDPGDIGAGFTSTKDLTNLGDLKKINDDIATNGTIKVGDLLHNERNGGHIAIIVGIDSEYYYVAQAVWFDEVGVIISKFQKDELDSEYPHVVLMDKYYQSDGNLTNMW